jgi:folate-dependent phosphoribosylglycinamide formyltransferase PurN
MKKINLTVIVIDGDRTGKYYLHYLYESGFKVNKVIILKKQKTIRSFLGKVRRLEFFKKPLIELPLEKIINQNFEIKILDEYNYHVYASEIEAIKVGTKNINDDALYEYMKSDNSSLYLFSGGGIVDARLLSNPNKKIIHIHPGIVPDIRGADCLFWSVLLRGKPGYSLFYMSAGIDEGSILHQEEFALPQNLCIDKKSYKIDVKQDSISLLKTLDLHYRSITLVNFLKKHYQGEADIKLVNATPQKQKDGRMYFLMHAAIKKIAIKRLLFSNDT